MSDVSPARRALTFAALIAALGGLGTTVLALQFEGRIEAPPGLRRPAPQREVAVPRVAEMPASTEALRELLDARLRLRPDARALAALTALQRMHGRPARPVAARWSRDHWDLTLDETPFATLPEAADFDALLALVTQAAARTAPALADAPAPEAAAWPILTPARPATALLAALDGAWRQGSRSPAVLRAAARALVALCIETPDSVDAADPLAAQALAALAWARHAGHGDVEAEALLARHLGYDVAAERLAATLPDASPARPWIARDDARLRALVEAPGASEAASYLWYRRLVERGERDAAIAWRDARPAPVRAGVPVQGFVLRAYGHAPIERYRPLVASAPRELLRALEVEAGLADPGDAVPLLPRLAALHARLPAGGPFFDRATAAARADAVVLSSVEEDLHFRLHVWAAPEAGLELVDALGSPAPGLQDRFVDWARDLANVRARRVAAAVILDGLASDATLGAAFYRRSYDAHSDLVAVDDPTARLALERLVTHLDARPAHRAVVATEAFDRLFDVPRHEAACDALLAATRRGMSAARLYCHHLRGDTAALLAAARDPSSHPATRIHAVRFAARHRELDAAEVGNVWAEIDAATPATAPLERATWLEESGHVPEAIALLRGWLQAHGAEPGLSPIHARAALGRLLRRQGDAATSWALVEPDLRGMAGTSLAEGVRSLLALQRADEAEALARTNLARYPGASSVATLAEVLWTRGDDDRAADVLKENEAYLSDDAWGDTVGEVFANVHRAATVERVRRAFEPVTRRRLRPSGLWDMIAAFRGVGRRDLTVATYGMVRIADAPHTFVDVLFSRMQEYTYRKRAEGAEAAMAWLRGAVDPAMRAPLSIAAWPFHETEVLWTLVAPEGEADHAESVWLLRQCDALRHGAAYPHRAALDAHYAAPAASDYATMARYLRGEVTLPALLGVAVSEKRRTEVAYYVGLRAQAEGRVADATDWFTFALLAGTLHDGEHTWSRTALRRWCERGEPVAALSAHPWISPRDDDEEPAATSATPPPPERRHQRSRRHRR